MTLSARLAGGEVMKMTAQIVHARRGGVSHHFRTSALFILLDPKTAKPPRMMSLNRWNLFSFYERDHGGKRGAGSGSEWAWQQFEAWGFPPAKGRVLALLAQPRFLGYWFNPVSFWMLIEGDKVLAIIAEVNNTFGQRHSYLLIAPDRGAITKDTQLKARKIFHVSPFQDVSGDYHFGFSISAERIAIRISLKDRAESVYTAMAGPLVTLTSIGILGSALRRPGGAFAVVAQIFWHALRLKLKGAEYRSLPQLPPKDISR